MVISDNQIERLARSIHENFLRDQRQRGVRMGSAPAMTAWDDLDEDKREANRAQAREIEHKLAMIGCRIGRGPVASTFAFSAEELDHLARVEAVRWHDQRVAAGWTAGPRRDDAAKVHPMLAVAWNDLPEAEKEKDRDAVRHIPEVLASIGLRVVRRRRSS